MPTTDRELARRAADVAAAIIAEAAVRLRPYAHATLWAVALLLASWSTAAPVLHVLNAAS